MRKLTRGLLCFLGSALIGQAVGAASITSFTRAEFSAAVSGGVTSRQDFDGFAPLTILGTVGGVTYAASLGSPQVTNAFLASTMPNGLGSTAFGFFNFNETATLSFASPINAFAIDINTNDMVAGGFTATLSTGDVVSSVFDAFPGAVTGQFLGFLSDTPFTSVIIAAPGGSTYSLDTLVFAQADIVVFLLGEPPVSGNEVTSATLTQKNTSQLATTVTTHVGSVLRALFGRQGKRSVDALQSEEGVVPVAYGYMHTGQAAGEGEFQYPWGLWASYQHIFSEDDFPSTAFDSDTDQLAVGVDLSPWKNFVAGVALTYELTDVTTGFNRGEQDLDGVSVVPYLGAYLSDYLGVDFDLTMDMSIGYSKIAIDQFRTSLGTRVTSELDSERWFVSSNVNASRAYGNWYVSGRAGVVVAREDQEDFVESNSRSVARNNVQFGQLRLGGELAYTWTGWGAGVLEPFVGADYQYDFEREKVVVAFGPQPANDDDDVLASLGVRFYGRDNLSATLEYSKVLGREDFDSDSVGFRIRAEF